MLVVRPAARADIKSYSLWAAAVSQQDSTIDSDGLISASHATASMLDAFASGERSFAVSFDTHNSVPRDRLTFVEYHDSDHQLAGLLIADCSSQPSQVTIHRVLVSQDYRSRGSRKPTPSVMTLLGHKLISHCVAEQRQRYRHRIGFSLGGVACVLAHENKWGGCLRNS